MKGSWLVRLGERSVLKAKSQELFSNLTARPAPELSRSCVLYSLRKLVGSFENHSRHRDLSEVVLLLVPSAAF